MIDYAKLKRTLKDLGHVWDMKGTLMILEAVPLWDWKNPPMLTKQLYPAIAESWRSTPQRVERCMRHSIEVAWLRGNEVLQAEIFGFSISPATGKPTVGQYIASLYDYCSVSGNYGND